MDENKKQTVAKKIRALLAKTTDAGCTEQEALNAAALAAKLQADYDIDLTAAEVQEEGFDTVEIEWQSEQRQFIQYKIAVVISKFTSTQCWTIEPSNHIGRGKRTKKGAYKLVYYGFASDVIFAQWLLESLTVFIERSTLNYECYEMPDNYSNAQRRDARKAFIAGICDRINRRLLELIKPTVCKAATGTALIVLDKTALVKASLDEQGFKTQSKNRVSTKLNNDEAFYAGYREGEKASFGRPIGDSSEKQKLIN